MRPRTWIAVIVVALIALILIIARARSRGEGVAVDVEAAARPDVFRSYVSASGDIIATRFADIGSSVMGRLVELSVAEGDRVTAGQVLAVIDPVQAASETAAAGAQVRALESEARAASEQFRAAQSEQQQAQARAREAAAALKRLEALYQERVVSTAELDTARATAEAAEAQVGAARAAVARAERSAEAASKRIDQAKAQMARAQDILSKTRIEAPIDGVVSRLQVREGEMVVIGIQNQPGTTLMTISDLSAINAEVKVAEADVLRTSVGQRATVTLDALPGQPFTGRVVEVGASALPPAGPTAAAREFRVVIRLDNPVPGLRPGLTCDAEILTDERRQVVTVPLQAVVLRPVEEGERRGVFVLRDGRAVFTPVKTGVIGGLAIEVDGIPAGAPVIVGPYQLLRELEDAAEVRPNARAAK